jgi:NTP pyrophosphatase (non-canonical NTP hydrolase)
LIVSARGFKMGFFDAFKIREMERALKASFSKIKFELDDQREAINENTNEIQSNFEYVDELDKKIDKLSERLDDLNLYLANIARVLNIDTIDIEEQRFEQLKISLTRHEKEVFSIIYVMCEQDVKPTLKRLSTRLGYTTEMTKNYLLQLMDKGIPLSITKGDNDLIIDLDPAFRRVQTRKNIVGLDSSLMAQFSE